MENDKSHRQIFSQNLKRLMTERNISQNQLSNMIGVTKATVSRYENGLLVPKYNTLLAIAKALNVSVDELVL